MIYASRGDACDIWTAATGVAAFQNARIPPRVLNRKSPADTSRFEKRWFRVRHSRYKASGRKNVTRSRSRQTSGLNSGEFSYR